MEKLLNDFSSPSWWIGIVLVTIVLNIASAYLKPRIDSALLRSSGWWRARSATRLARREEFVQGLINDDREMNSAYFWAVHTGLQITGLVVAMTFCATAWATTSDLRMKRIVLVAVTFAVIYCVYLVRIASFWTRGIKEAEARREAETKKQAEEPSSSPAPTPR